MSRTIEWGHDGSRLVVPVIVYPPLTGTTFEGIAGNALIDTGSTTTGVTAKIAQKLGLKSISFDALLGMDILRQCELLITPGNRCRLRFGS